MQEFKQICATDFLPQFQNDIFTLLACFLCYHHTADRYDHGSRKNLTTTSHANRMPDRSLPPKLARKSYQKHCILAFDMQSFSMKQKTQKNYQTSRIANKQVTVSVKGIFIHSEFTMHRIWNRVRCYEIANDSNHKERNQ